MIKPFAFMMTVIVLTACSLVVVTNQRNPKNDNSVKNVSKSSISSDDQEIRELDTGSTEPLE